MNTKQVYRVGIVGCGRMASTVDEEKEGRSGRFPQPVALASAYRQVQGSEVVAAADVDRGKLAAFSERWGVDRVYTDYREMMAEEELDIVSVATHAPLHCEITVAAAETGVRGVLCEKVMTTNLADADRMIAACREAGTVLSVHYHNRWDPLMVKVQQMVADGAIGQLRSVTGNMGPELVHEATHLFDLMRFLVGDEVEWAFGRLDDEPPLEPGGSGYLLFRNGVHAFVNAIEACPVGFEFDLIGMEGRIRIGYQVDELWTVAQDAYEGQALVGRKIPQNMEVRSGTVKAIEELVACVETGREPSCTGEDGRAALELALAFHVSHRAGGEKVHLPLTDSELNVDNQKYHTVR